MKSTNNKPFKPFEQLTPSQKTIRFRLLPVGRTAEFLKKRNIIELDRVMHEAYPLIKELADEYYRQLAYEQLADFQIDWSPLEEALSFVSSASDPKQDREISERILNEQKNFRSLLFKRLSGQVDRLGKPFPREIASKNLAKFKGYFLSPLVTDTLPQFLENLKNNHNTLMTEEQYSAYKSALELYRRFTSRLTNFWDSRRNVFTDEAIVTSITHRLVHEIFPDFLSNKNLYEQNKNHFVAPLGILESELKKKRLIKEHESIDQLFDLSSFNRLLTQQGVDLYNAIIGGFFTDEKTKIQGFNELVNLKNQQLKKDESKGLNDFLGKMTRFKKQILAKSESTSFLIDQIEGDADLWNRLKEFHNMITDKDVDGLSTIDSYQRLFALLNDADLTTIWVDAKNLNKLSHKSSQSWNRIRDGLHLIAEQPEYRKEDRYKRYVEASNEDRDFEKLKKKIYFNLHELQLALNNKETDEDETKEAINILSPFDSSNEDFAKELNTLFTDIKDFVDNENKLQGNPDAVAVIKQYLDSIMTRYSIWQLLTCEESSLRDLYFYPEFLRVMDSLGSIINLYNLTRNYLSQKPDQKKKFKLNFNNPTLADGWSESKVTDNSCILLRKDDLYYLGILKDRSVYNNLRFVEHLANADQVESPFKRMLYYFYPNAYRMIPKCSTARNDVKRHFIDGNNTTDYRFNPSTSSFCKPFSIPLDIFQLQTDTVNGKKKYQIEYMRQTGDETGYRQALIAWIDFCKSFLASYQGTGLFDYSNLLESEEYEDINQFYSDVDRASYSIAFEKIPSSVINEMVETGDLYLFQLYNKDFSPHSTGKPNLHTVYWRALFSDENLESRLIKLNGQAELFFRPKQIEQVTSHKKGSYLLNKFDRHGEAVPADLYLEVHNHINMNNPSKEELSEEAAQGLEEGRFVYREAPYELVKNRRYTEDQLFFHVPTEINWAESSNIRIDDLAKEYIKNSSDMHVIGIDRGERHLLYYSVTNLQGEIVEQGSWNTIAQTFVDDRGETERRVPYHSMITQREEDRAKARLNWQSIDRIKDLKEGFLGQVIHELSKLIIKYNAIVVLEDLNTGFKRGRFKVERQVYQKFEVALMNKLNALSFKTFDPSELGGVMRPWQLTRRIATLKDAGRQNGIVFYVPASYTSVVDPVTGFANLFFLNRVKKDNYIDFYKRFSEISYDPQASHFIFRFNYKDFGNYCRIKNPPSRNWDIISGQRIKFVKELRKTVTVDTTNELKQLFETKGVDFASGDNILPQILGDVSLLPAVNYLFRLIMELRYTIGDTDAIVSPALDEKGNYFDTREHVLGGKYPVNADANGAFNIARKGILLVNKLKQDVTSPFITNKEWFEHVMKV